MSCSGLLRDAVFGFTVCEVEQNDNITTPTECETGATGRIREMEMNQCPKGGQYGRRGSPPMCGEKLREQ